MKTRKTLWATLYTGVALVALTPETIAQSSEALMDALVRKGILTEQEAEDIKADVAKENRQYNKITLGGKTISGLNLYGDFRGRFESFYGDNPLFVDRNRFRYRLRVGATYSMTDKFEVGFRLTSSEPSGSFGGDPISGNTTFQDNGSKKFVFIDQAYGKWNPLTGPNWMASVIVGKMENPFVFSDMIFDADYTPEGAGLQLAHVFNDKHTLRAIAGAFVLDEIGSVAADPYLYGAQIRWEAAWTPKWLSSAGVAMLNIVHKDNLSNGGVPNINRGNTRTNFVSALGTNLVPAFSFNPIIADAALTYTLDRVPLYPGAFPIRVGGDFMYNPAAESGTDNYAYSAGVTFGKAGKKGAWELAYTYKWLGADSWWEEFTDSDFGSFYGVSTSGTGAGYSAGTNVKGHIARAAYSPFDSIVLNAKVFLTTLINSPPGNGHSEMIRLQLDANWKF
jgi:hypothetical protein